jgi:glucokinase
MSHRLAVDIGGSHVTAALVDVEARRVVFRSLRRAPVREADPATAILDAWSGACLAAAAAGPAPEGVSLAVPAPFDADAGASLMTHKFRALHSLPLLPLLHQRWVGTPLDGLDIRIANDADCFALGEWWAGLAQTDVRVIGITLGTGLGSGFVRDGRIVSSAADVPDGGELWDLPYLDGRAEDYTAGRFITASWRALSGQTLDAAAVARLARGGDARAAAIFAAFGGHLGAVLRPHLDAFRPSRVVVGGNLARAWPLFEATLRAATEPVPCVLSADPESSTLLGAAAHWEAPARVTAAL